MAVLKKNLMAILFAVAVVGSLGMAGWAYMAGEDVNARLKKIDDLRTDVKNLQNGAANPETIAERAAMSKRRNEAMDEALAAALYPQKFNTFENRPRQLLIPDILPTPKSDAARIDFKRAYNTAFAEVGDRLHARDKPTSKEKLEELQRQMNANVPVGDESYPWRPQAPAAALPGPASPLSGDVTAADALKRHPEARVAETIAKQIHMYITEGAIGPHLAGDPKATLTPELIWQAHMTLWVVQDFAAALGTLNEKRVKALEEASRGQDAWVANMPVKHIKLLVIDGKFGRDGGTNLDQKTRFATSFTRDANNRDHFMVPMFLVLVVEEAAVMDVIDAVCGIGYYTPMRIEYEAVPQNAIQEDYIYGEAPVVEMKIDMEAYFFRTVYEPWIPEVLKKILETPLAEEKMKGRG